MSNFFHPKYKNNYFNHIPPKIQNHKSEKDVLCTATFKAARHLGEKFSSRKSNRNESTETFRKNLEEHFIRLGLDQSEPYLTRCEELAKTQLPPIPTRWRKVAGWTRYSKAGEISAVITRWRIP
ncbi:unnamed protein product [Rhizopus stolonifer]